MNLRKTLKSQVTTSIYTEIMVLYINRASKGGLIGGSVFILHKHAITHT
jgi:hypothetical protein